MSKVIDFFMKHMDAIIIGGTIITVAGAAIGASIYNKEKDRKLKASMPDSYWDAQARSSEAEANAKIEIAKIRSETELQKAQDEYEALKNMPDSYFDMKKAEIARDASVKAAKIDAEARTASAREQRMAINNAIDSLTKESK
jgi:3-phosphoglycerate kinase